MCDWLWDGILIKIEYKPLELTHNCESQLLTKYNCKKLGASFKDSRYKNYPDGEIYKSNIAKSEIKDFLH